MEEAEALLRDMQRRRISANVITYNMLLRGYAERGDLKVGISGLVDFSAEVSGKPLREEGTDNRKPSSCSQWHCCHGGVQPRLNGG